MWQRAHFIVRPRNAAEVYSTVSCSQTFRLNMYQLRARISGGANDVGVAGRDFVARQHFHDHLRHTACSAFSDSTVQSRQRQMCRCE